LIIDTIVVVIFTSTSVLIIQKNPLCNYCKERSEKFTLLLLSLLNESVKFIIYDLSHDFVSHT